MCFIFSFSAGETNMNLTGLYDMLTQLSEELRITKKDLEATKESNKQLKKNSTQQNLQLKRN